jgi:branched-chain amino acid transport system substrate-binding protein
LAVAPIAEETHTVLFTMASLATKLNSAGDYVFKNDDISSKIGTSLALEARKRGFASAATLFAAYNDAVVEYNEAFVKAFAEKGGTITGSEGFTQDTTDLRTQIQKLIAGKPATIAVMGLQRDCAIAVRQIRELGYANQLFGYTCFDDPGTLAAAGNAAEGIIMNGYNGMPTPLFTELVKKVYGHEPLRWSAEAFDGLKLLAVAIAQSYDTKHPISPETLKKTLSSIRGYTGEAGHADFDTDGNASREAYVKTVHDGKIEIVK